MFLILFQRVMPLEDKIVLYVVPKYINYNNKLSIFRSYFKKEQDCLAKDVYMLKPILIGNYNKTRHQLDKICKNDSILEKYTNSELVLNYNCEFNSLNIADMNNFSNDIKKRLQFVLKEYESKSENKLVIDFDQIIKENFIEYKSFYKIKSTKHVKFDLQNI